MSHRVKIGEPVTPPPSALWGALKDGGKWFTSSNIFGRGDQLPDARNPNMKSWYKQPRKAVGRFVSEQGKHLSRLGEPGGVTRALTDVTPMSATMMLAPELLNMGVIRAVKDTPAEHKGEAGASALGRMAGGQLMMRGGLASGMAGSAVGGLAGKYIGKGIDALASPFTKKTPAPAPQPQDSYEMSHKKLSSSFGDVEQPLPEVAGNSPRLTQMGPGMDEIIGKGRRVAKTSPSTGIDTYRDLGGDRMNNIFYADNGLGSGGGQPHADISEENNVGILRGLVERLKHDGAERVSDEE